MLRELAPGVTLDDIAAMTEASYRVGDDVAEMSFGA